MYQTQTTNFDFWNFFGNFLRLRSAPDFIVTYKSKTCYNHNYVCSRSIFVTIGKYIVKLVDGSDPEISGYDPEINYILEEQGFFYILQTSIGLTVFWDHGTRVYIRVATNHYGTLCGLCGNYDGIDAVFYIAPNFCKILRL